MKDATMAQGKQLMEFLLRAEDPYAFVQNLIERWGAVQLIGKGEVTQAQLMEALKHIETLCPFPDEQVKLKNFLPRNYQHAIGDVLAQRLQKVRPEINLVNLAQRIAGCKPNENGDGIYVIPKVSYEAKRLGLSLEEARANFGRLIEGACEALSSTRKFNNYRAGELGPERLEVVDKTWEALMELEKQPGDVAVFSAQTGGSTKYAGRRPDWSRWQMEHSTHEWPLSPYEVAWMLVGNPHRLASPGHLIIDCTGVRYKFGADGEFGYVLYLRFDDGELYLRDGWVGDPSYGCGAGGGFLQQ